MHEEFDDQELEPVLRQHDTELTLGPKLLLGILAGLVLLCGLFFGVGYSMGRRATISVQPAAPVAVKTKDATQENAKPKPSATTQGKADKMVATYADTHSASSSDQTPDVDARTLDSSVRPEKSSPQADSGATTLMVQIAAVSHQEDAQVLEGALRKRGYRVTVSRDVLDNLIHVRIGPFSSRDEAGKWRQKLLGDGYNAIVQP